MTVKKRAIIAIVAVAVIVIFYWTLLSEATTLVVRDNDNVRYFEKNIRQGDIVSLEFKHSVEKIRWVDTFIVLADDRLMLTNTTFDSSGAGIPSELSYNITTDENGNYTIRDINEIFEGINFITGSTPKHYLIVSGEKYPIYSSVPEGKPLFLFVERNTLAGIVFNKIRSYI